MSRNISLNKINGDIIRCNRVYTPEVDECFEIPFGGKLTRSDNILLQFGANHETVCSSCVLSLSTTKEHRRFEEVVDKMTKVLLVVCLELLTVSICTKYTNSQSQEQFVSPCPRLFSYDTASNVVGRWYGIINFVSDIDLNGIWLRILLDRPSLQLGNWFGQVLTTDNKEFLIKNRKFVLSANTTHRVQLYINYDPSEPVPKLVSYKVNGKPFCPPEGTSETRVEYTSALQTGSTAQPPRPPIVANTGRPLVSGGNASSIADEEDYYPSDFSVFQRPAYRPNQNGSTFDLEAECGKVTVPLNPFTTDQRSTTEGQFPWHAALYYARSLNLDYVCGATLISKHHVITVAHCVTRRQSRVPLIPEHLVVYLGKYYLRRFSNTGIQDKHATLIFPHQNYNPDNFNNDIAIVKFRPVAEITDFVRPICLWKGSTDLYSLLNQQGTVVGWGFDETGKVNDQLTQSKLSVVPIETCVSTIPNFYSRFTSSNTYCAGSSNGSSVCNGDSGEGMAFSKLNSHLGNPVWQLRGLVSISVIMQPQFSCNASYVGYTDAAKYMDWIKEAMTK